MWEAYIRKYTIFSDTLRIYLIGQITLCLAILAGTVLPNKTEVLQLKKNRKYILCSQVAMSVTNTFPGPRIYFF